MTLIKRFVGFWIDFIFGDAWEVAIAIALAMLAGATLLSDWGDRQAMGFGLLAVILAANAVALWRIAVSSRS